MQDVKETEVCVEIKPKKIYIYDRTRTKVCCFCGLSIRYDCLARHKLTKKCNIIKNLLKDQLAKTEAGIKVIIPDFDTNERKNKRDPNKKRVRKTKKPIEVE